LAAQDVQTQERFEDPKELVLKQDSIDKKVFKAPELFDLT